MSDFSFFSIQQSSPTAITLQITQKFSQLSNDLSIIKSYESLLEAEVYDTGLKLIEIRKRVGKIRENLEECYKTESIIRQCITDFTLQNSLSSKADENQRAVIQYANQLVELKQNIIEFYGHIIKFCISASAPYIPNPPERTSFNNDIIWFFKRTSLNQHSTFSKLQHSLFRWIRYIKNQNSTLNQEEAIEKLVGITQSWALAKMQRSLEVNKALEEKDIDDLKSAYPTSCVETVQWTSRP